MWEILSLDVSIDGYTNQNKRESSLSEQTPHTWFQSKLLYPSSNRCHSSSLTQKSTQIFLQMVICRSHWLPESSSLLLKELSNLLVTWIYVYVNIRDCMGLPRPRKFNYFELSFLFFPPPHSNPYLWKSKVTGFLLILRLELKVCGLFRSLESCYTMFSNILYHVELPSNSVPLSISIQTHAHTHTIQKAS